MTSKKSSSSSVTKNIKIPYKIKKVYSIFDYDEIEYFVLNPAISTKGSNKKANMDSIGLLFYDLKKYQKIVQNFNIVNVKDPQSLYTNVYTDALEYQLSDIPKELKLKLGPESPPSNPLKKSPKSRLYRYKLKHNLLPKKLPDKLYQITIPKEISYHIYYKKTAMSFDINAVLGFLNVCAGLIKINGTQNSTGKYAHTDVNILNIVYPKDEPWNLKLNNFDNMTKYDHIYNMDHQNKLTENFVHNHPPEAYFFELIWYCMDEKKKLTLNLVKDYDYTEFGRKNNENIFTFRKNSENHSFNIYDYIHNRTCAPMIDGISVLDRLYNKEGMSDDLENKSILNQYYKFVKPIIKKITDRNDYVKVNQHQIYDIFSEFKNKIDVFQLAYLFTTTFFQCFKNGTVDEDFLKIQTYIKSLCKRALHLDPTKRINLCQFSDALKLVIKKAVMAGNETKERKKIIFRNLDKRYPTHASYNLPSKDSRTESSPSKTNPNHDNIHIPPHEIKEDKSISTVEYDDDFLDASSVKLTMIPDGPSIKNKKSKSSSQSSIKSSIHSSSSSKGKKPATFGIKMSNNNKVKVFKPSKDNKNVPKGKTKNNKPVYKRELPPLRRNAFYANK